MAQDIRELAVLGMKPESFTFTGADNEDPVKFFKKLDRLAIFSNWTNEKKLNAIPLLLDGKSFDFYEGLSTADKNDFTLAKTAIIEHFKPNRATLVKWNSLNKMSMETDQSVTDFYDKLNREAAKIGDISDSQLLMIFLNGIHQNIRIQVASHEPTTLKAALEKAKLYESISEMGTSQAEKRSIAVINKTTEELISLIKSLQETIFQMKIQMGISEGLNTEHVPQGKIHDTWNGFRNVNSDHRYIPMKGNRNSAQHYGDSRPQGRHVKDERICFHCGIRGHIRAYCRNYRRPIEQNNARQTLSNVEMNTMASFTEDLITSGKINGQNAKMLIDSGSSVTILSESFWSKFYPKPKLSIPKFQQVTGVGGNASEVLGAATVEMKLGEFTANVEIHVVCGTNYDCIIGRDFLNRFARNIKWQEGLIELSHPQDEKQIPAPRKPLMPVYPADTAKICSESIGRLVRGVVLKPNASKLVKIYPELDILSLEVAIKNLPQNSRDGLRIEENTQKGLKGCFTCRVTNLTDRTVRLTASAPIARIFDTSSTPEMGLNTTIYSN